MDAVETKVKTENSVTVAGAGQGGGQGHPACWPPLIYCRGGGLLLSSYRTLPPSSKQDKQIRAQVYFVPISVQPFCHWHCSPCCVTDQDLDNTK